MPYRDVDEEDPEAGFPRSEPTVREDILLLVPLFVFSAGPIVSYLIFGTGSGVEMGIGAVVSFGAAVALYRTLRAVEPPPDPDDDDGAAGSGQEQ